MVSEVKIFDDDIFPSGVAGKKFDFSRQEEWPKWSRRFERFRQASGLSKEEEESQINTLIYAMGAQADDILHSFNLTTTQLKQYHTVKARFDEHFVVRRNTIFERARLNRRRQEGGETVDTFITVLHAMAEHCDYRTRKDEDHPRQNRGRSFRRETIGKPPTRCRTNFDKSSHSGATKRSCQKTTNPVEERLQGVRRNKNCLCCESEGNTEI